MEDLPKPEKGESINHLSLKTRAKPECPQEEIEIWALREQPGIHEKHGCPEQHEWFWTQSYGR